jgi:hypothetical protein
VTDTTASGYDAAAVDLVVRTLRAVAASTPADALGVTDGPAIALVPEPHVDRSINRRRLVRGFVGLTAAAAAALLAVALWARDGGQLEMAPSDDLTPAAASRPLGDKQEIARGEVDGSGWRLAAWPGVVGTAFGMTQDGICVELTVDGDLSNSDRGWCSSVPTDDTTFGWFTQDASLIEGSAFVYGAVVPEAAKVTAELADGQERRVETTRSAFGYRYFVAPIPAGSDVVGLVALNEDGVELGRA